MSNPGSFLELEYEAESSWAEDVTTFATHRLPLISFDHALSQEMIDPGGVYGDPEGGPTGYIRGKMGGTVTMRLDLPGHGATTAGSPSIDPIETFLGIVFGTRALSATASDTASGADDTTTIPTTAASGFSAGGLVFIGALGDGDGEGQCYPVVSHASSEMSLGVAMPGAVAANAVLYPVAMMYPSSSLTSRAVTGTRFRILTGNLCYECHGCWPQSVSITGLSPGERPQIEIVWGVSWFRETASGTIPSAVTSNRHNPGIIAAGSLHVQDVGTTTRNARTCRSFSINYGLNVMPQMGPGGVNAQQVVVGAVRGGNTITVTWSEDADATTTTPVLSGYATDGVNKLIMWTSRPTIGKRIAILLRNVCITSYAVQHVTDGINRLEITGRAHTGGTTTNDLTKAPFVLGFA